MIVLDEYPLLSLVAFSIVPILGAMLGALLGYIKANQLKVKGEARDNERSLRIGIGLGIGIGVGLLIDLPFLFILIYFFSYY